MSGAARHTEHGPIVGILAGRSTNRRYSLHEGYVHAVAAVGAVPLVFPVGPTTDIDRLMTQVLSCDAVVLIGGGDVDAALSQIDDPTLAHESDRARDDAEIAAIHEALETGRAVLGICRGAQVLAVAYGGTLIGDLPSAGHLGHGETDREYEPVHGILPDEGTLVSTLLGTVTAVNSTHHQAVAVPGRGYRATAWSPDGVIEAIEGPGALGIQWHPELLFAGDERHLAPFRWLIS